MALIDLTRGPSGAPLPAIVVQGLPDGGGAALLDLVRCTYPRLRVALAAAPAREGDPLGCNQCHLTDSLLERIAALPAGAFDRLWIEVPPTLEVGRLTAALEREQHVAVHLVVTCLDAARLPDDFAIDRTLAERCGAAAIAGLPAGTRAGEISVLERLSGFIESCDLIWLHGADPEGRAAALVRRLHPDVDLVSGGPQAAAAVAHSRRRFDPEATYAGAAWQLAVRRHPSMSTPECFRARRPFHPERFDDLIARWPESILRTFGSVWLATPGDDAMVVDQLGPAGFFVRPDGQWLASLPAREQRDLLRKHPDLRATWDPVWGDRMTELAFVSDEPLGADWHSALAQCLLSDFEMRLDWGRFVNPFRELWEVDASPAEAAERDSEETSRAVPPLSLVPGNRRD